jgi:hypothetical protein
MIDVEWLKTVQFEANYGRVTGLVAIGSEWIVFKCQDSGENPEMGKDTVIKILNTPRLGFHIRGIPPDLESKPKNAKAIIRRFFRHCGKL